MSVNTHSTCGGPMQCCPGWARPHLRAALHGLLLSAPTTCPAGQVLATPPTQQVQAAQSSGPKLAAWSSSVEGFELSLHQRPKLRLTLPTLTVMTSGPEA